MMKYSNLVVTMYMKEILQNFVGKREKKRNFFLFSDILIYSQALQSTIYKVHGYFSLLALSVKDLPDTKSKRLINAFEIHSDKKSFIVYSDTPKEKEEWLKHLRKAIEDYKASANPEEVSALAPVWVQDSDAKACKQCEIKFTITNRRHHCRQCGEVVCGNCSSSKRSLKGQGRVRICDTCVNRPADWTPSGKPGPVHTTIFEESDSDSDIEVIYELEAQYTYSPEPSSTAATKKLAFKKGDIISILIVDDSGWWLGELPSGDRGWVPQNYLAV